jgi:hypothetical protein
MLSPCFLDELCISHVGEAGHAKAVGGWHWGTKCIEEFITFVIIGSSVEACADAAKSNHQVSLFR